MTKSINKQVEA